MTLKRCYRPGDRVETATTSGQPIVCTVIEKTDLPSDPTDTWFLRSPTHGYGVYRHISEMRLLDD